MADDSDQFAGMRVTFACAADGRINRVSIPLEPAVAPIVFNRAATPGSF
jgi:hypothetical protein